MMRYPYHTITLVLLTVALSSCGGGVRHKDSIGSLNKKVIKVEEPLIEDSLEKAMQAYRKFLTETDETEMTPEAMRRLADLQLEASSGSYDFVKPPETVKKPVQEKQKAVAKKPVQQAPVRPSGATVKQESIDPSQFGKSKVESPILEERADGTQVAKKGITANPEIKSLSDEFNIGPRSVEILFSLEYEKNSAAIESEGDFEKRATGISKPAAAQTIASLPEEAAAEQQQQAVIANAEEAIALYKKLLDKYPLYERNDQVMYQLARAYEESTRQEEAKAVLDKLVKKYPTSVHYDEAQFRRGEIFFVRRKYFDSEKAYTHVVNYGPSSAFYDQSLFKRGWSFFKQSLYEEGLDDFVKLLDIKTAAGYHIKTETNKTEYQRVDDTFRVVSLSFSYLGGPSYINDYFSRRGHRDYEYLVYSYLGEHYLIKRRYQDAADAYNTFISLNPYHEKSPSFHIHTIEIYRKGQFPKLVIDAKREFAITYDLNGAYWTYHDINQFQGILAFIKTNLTDLAKHYHALSQRSKKRDKRREAYLEAARWYRSFLASFPEDKQAPELNFLLAELLFDNKEYKQAAEEYERTAYAYPVHPKSAESGYAAILSFREYKKQAPEHLKAQIHLEAIRSSLQFADTYPAHPQAADVLTSAAESLYALKEYDRAIMAAQKVLERHAKADPKLISASWIVVAHSKFDLQNFPDAEQAYQQVLKLLPKKDKRKTALTDKLAASIYKQGEQHKDLGELDLAVEDFLRIANVAPRSKIRQTAEFDAATALITLKDWDRGAKVLEAFRKNYPKNPLQYDVTTKLAFVYQESGQAGAAAREYQRIADDSKDTAVKQEALQKAAELYTQAEQYPAAISMHKRFIKRYADPVEPALEARQQLAELYKKIGQQKQYTKTLKEIVAVDKKAGKQRNERTRFLAANAALVLAEPVLKVFKDAPLGPPFKKTLAAKKKKMQRALNLYGDLADYNVAEVTAAATFQIANIYYEFSTDLLESERPKKLSAEELEQYDLLLEEQAYPFEEKAIEVHEKNVELLSLGVYNRWIAKSLESLGRLLPVRYAKQEQGEKFVLSIY